jgi:hypothetical protein
MVGAGSGAGVESLFLQEVKKRRKLSGRRINCFIFILRVLSLRFYFAKVNAASFGIRSN